ncbi:MAG TPA: hypothetical protein VEJ89_01270 [Myxococcaceae bacterium]|jgi:hypothetical protein|nr:hypothetical protein [Myxococcaceae bacterium]
MKSPFLASVVLLSTLRLAASADPPAVGAVRMQRSASIDKVLVGPRGEVFALLLAEGSVVVLPPHLASDLGFEPGQRVQVEGDAVQTPLNFVYHRVRLTRAGVLLISAPQPGEGRPPGAPPDGPPPGDPVAETETTRSGTLEAFLAAPDGRVNGLVFADGTVAMGGPHQSIDVSGLTRGTSLQISGTAPAGAAALRLERMTLPDGTVRALQPLASAGKRE